VLGSFGRMVSQAFPEDWRAFMISFVHLRAETESSAPLVIQPASQSATILNQSIRLLAYFFVGPAGYELPGSRSDGSTPFLTKPVIGLSS